MKKYTLILMAVLLSMPLAFALETATEEGINELFLIRPKRGMGQGIEHVIYIDDKEIGRLTNGSLLTYTFKEEGKHTILVKMLLLGAPSGTPFTQEIEITKEQPVYVDLRVTYANIAEILDSEKKALKLIDKCSYKRKKAEE